MFRFFEGLVDPYTPYDDTDVPPSGLFRFLTVYLRPFRKLLLAIVVTTAFVGTIEVLLIYFAGYVVDMLNNTSPDQVFAEYGWTLLLVAGFVLLIRPVIQVLDAALMNQSLMPNFGTLIRWRSHRHVLRQSVGWFENDFAGRIANRIMQTAPAAGEAIYQILDAVVYAVIYLIGALWLLADTDPRLAVPLLIWLLFYVVLVRWTMSDRQGRYRFVELQPGRYRVAEADANMGATDAAVECALEVGASEDLPLRVPRKQ